MKGTMSSFQSKSFGLYIPHGSDERSANIEVALLNDNFISHMVQMKAGDKATAQAIREALYPTWFRWK